MYSSPSFFFFLFSVMLASVSPSILPMESLTFSLQALLHRHETYMAEAEEDRNRLLANVERLEQEKRDVEDENARILEENRGLLAQLDVLNRAVAESDSTIKTLTTQLETTQIELRRMAMSAAREEELEAQLSAMEAEQAQLQQKLIVAKEDERSAVQRWKKAECMLRDLHEQVDRMEKEAREERERHVELIQRMERRRAVERELDNAAGRLKGAAATSAMDRNQRGSTVVSSFVRDILQDNANLQMGIIELREMLQSSNEEVQNLREQILLHQPMATVSNERDEQQQEEKQPKTTLSEELESTAQRISQEFHVHHHYHSPAASAGSKGHRSSISRRSKKKRPAPILLHSASGSQTPTRSRKSSTSSTSTIMSQTAVTIPPSAVRRRSLQSGAAESSLASSPQSGYRSSSIFDQMDNGVDYSEPTSPESTTFSPAMTARRRKGLSDISLRTVQRPESPKENGLGSLEDELSRLSDQHLEHSVVGEDMLAIEPAIPEETEDSSSPTTPAPGAGFGQSAPPNKTKFTSPSRANHLRKKSASHESLLSVSGMDIHTLRERPSQLSFHSRYFARFPKRIATTSLQYSSTPPVISTTNIEADRVSLRSVSSKALLASVADRCHPPVSPSETSDEGNHHDDSTPAPAPGRAARLRRRVGSWVLGRWGMAPVSSKSDMHGDDASSTSSKSTAEIDVSKTQQHKPDLPSRPPGVNQKGPILGLRPPPPAPSSVNAEVLDEEALRESLTG